MLTILTRTKYFLANGCEKAAWNMSWNIYTTSLKIVEHIVEHFCCLCQKQAKNKRVIHGLDLVRNFCSGHGCLGQCYRQTWFGIGYLALHKYLLGLCRFQSWSVRAVCSLSFFHSHIPLWDLDFLAIAKIKKGENIFLRERILKNSVET